MSIAALVRSMANLGATAEMIALAVEAVEAEQAKITERKAKDAARKARQRDSHGTVTGQSTESHRDTPSPPLSPLSPSHTLPLSPLNPPTPTISVERKRSTTSEFFERLWTAYPKRDGANPKQPALKAFNREVAAGADPEAIIAGATHYAAEQRGKDARFVAQLVTWLNQKRWGDHTPAAPSSPVEAFPQFKTREEHQAWWDARHDRLVAEAASR